MLNICKKIADDNHTCMWLDCCCCTNIPVYCVCQWRGIC